MKCKIGRNSVEVNVLLYELGVLVRNSARMKCKVARDSVEVNVLLLQLGVLVRNSARMKCKVSRDSIEVKVLLFQLGALVSNSVRIQFSTQLLTQTPNWNIKTLTSTESLPTLHFNLRFSNVEPEISRPFLNNLLQFFIKKLFGKDFLTKMCFHQNLV